MIYLHYKDLEQIDLSRILGVTEVFVLIPRITIRELDKHKNTHQLRRIRDRAGRTLKKIEAWQQDGAVRPGVFAHLLTTLPTLDYKDLGLNPEWNDDVLVATILEYKRAHPGEDVVLVSQDTGPRMTASHLGIRALELPDTLKLPVELDPLEAENRRLTNELATLQNALPWLTVCFGDGEAHEQKIIIDIQAPPDGSEECINQNLEKVRKQVPKRYPPEVEGIPQLALLTQVGPIPPEEYERYNRAVDSFLVDYERYLREKREFETAPGRSKKFRIQIRNGGTAPADDVDIQLNFPDGFILLRADDPPCAPEEPDRPRQPRTSMEMLMSNLRPVDFSQLSRPYIPNFTQPSTFKITRTNSYDVRDHFPRVKHYGKAKLPEMLLIFDSYESAASFHCEYIVRAANLPEPVKGQLHFVVKKATSAKRRS